MAHAESARPILELLTEWSARADLRLGGEAIPLPAVTLHLRSGRDVEGLVLNLSDTASGPHVLLGWLVPEDERRPVSRTHIPVAAIEAVTLHGYGPGEPSETAPTLLQFRRNLIEWEQTLSADFGVPIGVGFEGGVDDMAALEALRQRLTGVMHAFARDAQARQAIAESVRRVDLSTAAEPEAALVSGTLRMVTSSEVARRMGPDRLRQAIEGLL